jgi:two-component system sensor histidine kinase KdpD
LNRLIAQAVEMAQLDTQEVHMHLQPTNVEDVIQHGMHACASQIAGRRVSVNVEAPLPRVLADVTWLQKVICNLIENAAKYSPDDESSITVKAAVVDRETIAVTVTDRGVGIAESEQVLIFEKFYRGRFLAHRRPGTGMGLAISRAIVEAHHGTIGVSSALGEGSTFTVRLPIWRGTSYIG